MVVILYRRLADVAHLSSTCASHLVAAFIFEKLKEKHIILCANFKSHKRYLLVAFPALPDHGLCEFLLNLLPGALGLLNLITFERHVVALLAQSATLSSSFWIPADQDLVLGILHHSAVMAEWTFD